MKGRPGKKRAASLARRIQLPVLVLAVPLLILLAAVVGFGAYQAKERLLVSKARSMADFLVQASVSYLVNYDLAALEVFTKQVAKDSDFRFAVFSDPQGKAFTPEPDPAVVAGAAVIELPVQSPEGQVLGSLRLGYHRGRLHAELKQDVAYALAALATALLLLYAGMKLIVRRIARHLHGLTERLVHASENTASHAQEVLEANQGVAEAATRQAASLQQTSASLHEFASITHQNAEHADRARALAGETRTAADSGVTDMKALGQAMAGIQEASHTVAKSLKTIDEIAFQTNILALNAAVEAARAGEAGAGFAVVAEEVRALAQRSAQASRETEASIAESLRRNRQGVDLNAAVSHRFEEILQKIREVDHLVGEITGSAREQRAGVEQISGSMTQMEDLTQRNATRADESVHASAQLQQQAVALDQVVAELRLLVDGGRAEAKARHGADAAGEGTAPAPTVPATQGAKHELAAAE